MSTYLVTGGKGFIGSHIVSRLLEYEHEVRILDYKLGREYDIRDRVVCDKACAGVDYVLHQAALRSVPKSMAYPEEYNDVNIQGTLNMLQASAKHKVKCFVFASSSSVYGNVPKDALPVKEDYPTCPTSPYAITKLCGEHYCRLFSKYYNLKTVTLRYFNVYGPGQPLDDEYSTVIPKFIDCARKGLAYPIYGDGSQARDFTYVDDVVKANLLAVKGPASVYNVAAGEPRQVLSVATLISARTNTKMETKHLSQRDGDVYKTHADLSRSRKQLNYTPSVGLGDGLSIMLEAKQP